MQSLVLKNKICLAARLCAQQVIHSEDLSVWKAILYAAEADL